MVSVSRAALALSVVLSACSPSMRVAPELKAPGDAASIERGKYLAGAVLGCVDCHSPRAWDQIGAPPIEGREFTGGILINDELSVDGEAFPGVVQAPNISQHPEHGIGAWTDGEIARAIREGVNRDGKALFPMMPYLAYRHLSDEEVLDVIAFLRTIPPREGKVAERDLDFPLSMIVNFIPEPLEGPISAPAITDAVKKGERLVTLAGCNDCHSPMDKGEVIKGQEFSGGVVYRAKAMKDFGTVLVTNITPDEETGIGKVTEEQFVAMIREGKGKDGRGLHAFMPWAFYRDMNDDDLKAIYAYLRTVPAIKKDGHAILAEYSKVED